MNDVSPPPALAVFETEAALLGAMMIDNRIADQVADRLLPEHFNDFLHVRIYKVIRALRAAGDDATPVTIRGYFPKGSLVDEQGNDFNVPAYCAGLTGSGAGMIGFKTFTDQIIRFATYRGMRKTLQDGIDKIEAVARPYSFTEEAPELPDPLAIASDTSAAMLRAVESRNPNKITAAGSLLHRVRARAERAAAGISVGAKCKTIPDLNDIIGPAGPGQMTIIGGRSGMGKTVLACSAAWGYAVNGHPTLLISLEMTEDALAMRLAADLTFGMDEPVPFGDMTRNRETESQLLTVDEAARRIAQYPFQTVSPGRVTIEGIEAIVAREVSRLERLGLKLEVVVVDYIQIVAATGRLEGTARINHISEGLLGIAQRYGCHVFALSQLLRDIDKRPDRRPTVADLKESGRLEEDADNVVLVYRPEFYLVKEQPDATKESKKWEDWNIEMGDARGRVDVMGVKVRMGEQAVKRCQFFGKHQAIRGKDFVQPLGGAFGDEAAPLLPKERLAA
jgi:replicative DNA helicase